MQKEIFRHTLPIDTQKKTFFFPVFIYLFFFGNVGQSIAGEVVINEFLVDPTNTQWIELYNKSDAQIEISSWILDDDGGSQHFVIPSGTSIDGKGYKIFESGLFNLNKSTADTARLLNGGNIEDSYGYTIGPPANDSFGREGDGGGAWVIFQNPTKGSSNNGSQALVISSPTPTLDPPTIAPSLTNIPTHSKTPTPSKIPTPTRSPTPIKAPTQTKINTSPTKTSTQTLKVARSAVAEPDITALPDVTKIYPTAVLGVSNSSRVTPTKTQSRTSVLSGHTEKLDQNSPLLMPSVVGVGLLGGAVFYYFKKRREEADAV